MKSLFAAIFMLSCGAAIAAPNYYLTVPLSADVAQNLPTKLEITSASLPAAKRGKPYSISLGSYASTSGPQFSSIKWAQLTGELPSGLVLNPSTGVVAGTPTKTTPAVPVEMQGSVQDKKGDAVTASATFDFSVETVPLSGVTSVAAGYSTNCAVASGGVYCWGNNYMNSLGTASSDMKLLYPTPVIGLEQGVTEVAVYYDSEAHCAIQQGAVKCWGSNANSRMGSGSSESYQVVAATVIGLESGVTKLALSESSGCALKGGGVYCWGYGTGGELGNGAWNATQPTAQPAIGLTEGVTHLTSSGDHVCAVKSGQTFCWGTNVYGLLLNAPSGGTPVHVPGLDEFSDLTGHWRAMCGMKDGKGYCWGYDYYKLYPDNPLPSVIPGWTAGDRLTAAASLDGNHCVVDAAKKVKCIGINSSKDQNFTQLTPVLGFEGIKEAYSGNSTLCALTEQSTLLCVGNRYANGALGNGTPGLSTTPVTVLE